MSSNKNLILIVGKPSSGKTVSLRNVDAETTAYLNTDLKELPMRNANQFQEVSITDAKDLVPYIDNIEEAEGVQLGVLDTLTFAMEMFATQYVNAPHIKNTQKAWGDYASFYRNFIHAIKSGTKDYVIYAHTKDVLNESEMVMESKIPVSGQIGDRGVEADFSIILGAKRVPISKLDGWENDMLNITEDEEEDGYKYVFQTRATKDSVGDKMRSPMGLFSRKELYIDNCVEAVRRRVKEYYQG